MSAEINNDGEISFPSKGGTVKMIIAMTEIIERAARFFLVCIVFDVASNGRQKLIPRLL